MPRPITHAIILFAAAAACPAIAQAANATALSVSAAVPDRCQFASGSHGITVRCPRGTVFSRSLDREARRHIITY